MSIEQFKNWLELKPEPEEVWETFWAGKEEELEELLN